MCVEMCVDVCWCMRDGGPWRMDDDWPQALSPLHGLHAPLHSQIEVGARVHESKSCQRPSESHTWLSTRCTCQVWWGVSAVVSDQSCQSSHTISIINPFITPVAIKHPGLSLLFCLSVIIIYCRVTHVTTVVKNKKVNTCWRLDVTSSCASRAE